MSKKEQLLLASFRDIPFFLESERIQPTGRRIILHPYPNSDTQYVEDMGIIPKTFSINAYVAGDNWLRDTASLMNALDKEGSGLLILPHYGQFKAFALPYESEADQNQIGIVRFTLTFALGTNQEAPKVASYSSQDVYQKGDTTRQNLQDNFEEKWIPPETEVNSIVALSDFEVLTDEIENYLSVFSQAKNLTNKIDNILSSASSIILKSSLYAQSLFSPTDSLYQSISTNLYLSRSAINTMLSLFNFGEALKIYKYGLETLLGDDGVSYWPETTQERIDRNSNRELFVESVRLASLACAYEVAANIEYSTVQDVQQVRIDIETAYNSIEIEDATIRQSFLDLRIATLDILDQKEQEAFRVIQIYKPTSISATLLSHELYQESLLTEDDLESMTTKIRALNPTLSSINLVGDIEVFQV